MAHYSYEPGTVFYSLIRFSTVKQADGDSFRRQIDAAETFSAQEAINLDCSLHEADIRKLGMSALSGKHVVKGPINKFLGGIESGIVIPGKAVSLVSEWSRLTRQVAADALELVISLMRKGIGIIDLQDRAYYTLDRYNNDLGLQVGLQVKISMANQYSKNLSRNVGAAWVGKRLKIAAGNGKPTNACPLWLMVDEVTGEFVEREGRFAIVIRIFEMTRDGMGKRLIARILNDDGVPAFKGTNGWHHSSVQKILGNPAVRGIYQGYDKDGNKCGEPKEGFYPRVVSEELYKLAMAARDRRTSKTADGQPTGLGSGEKGSFPNLLAGLCTCVQCGAGLVYVNKGGEANSYLVCSKARRGLCGNNYHRPYDALEADLFNALSVVDYSRLLDRPPTQSDEAMLMEAEIAEKNAKKAALVAAFSSVIVPEVVGEIGRLQVEVEAPKAKLAEHKKATALAEIVAKQDNHAQFRSLTETRTCEVRGRIAAELRRIVESGEHDGPRLVIRLKPSQYWAIEFHIERSQVTVMLLRNLNGDGSEVVGYYALPGDAWVQPLSRSHIRITRELLFDPAFTEMWAQFAS